MCQLYQLNWQVPNYKSFFPGNHKRNKFPNISFTGKQKEGKINTLPATPCNKSYRHVAFYVVLCFVFATVPDKVCLNSFYG